MAGLMVAGAFLTPVIQVIVESVASRDYKDLFNKRLVNKLKIKLNSIQKVLDDAETKQYHDERVRFWLDNLKHVVYEVEQLLDEIATSAQRKSKVHRFRLVGRFKSKIKIYFFLLAGRFKSRINDLLDNLKDLLDEKDLLGLKEGIFARNEFSERVPTTSLVDESSKYGRQGEKEEIISFLLLNNNSSSTSNQALIISIVGLGGIGKTTLAQLVYNDHRVQKNFDLKAWVYVSESFDVIRLTKAILESFGSSPNTENLDLLQCQLQEKITGKKCLLVLDDIRKVDWESCEKLLSFFNEGSSGSNIIVTTRNKENALAMESKLFELVQLGESDSWSLFERHAFPNKKGSEYPDLEPIGKRIVGKCGGLPLAVITMGKLLRAKFSQSEWIEILEDDMWGLSEKDTGINPVLRLGYHNLPSNLKPCFAYCSIFPKGYKFDKNKLIKMWMANGLLNSYKSDKSKEKLGSELFNVLESISFFQKSLDFDGGFTMHDLVNDLAKSMSREFCLQVEDDKNVNHISKWTRHIWFSFDSEDADRILKHTYRSKGLHSLLIEPKSYKWTEISNNVQCDIFSKLKYLQMLSFLGSRSLHTELELELADEIGNLKFLRYLDVSWTSIVRLPNSICKLYNLETLILEKCYNLTELPINFSKLDRLRHLNLEGSAIEKMPKNIRKLTHLQTLTNFIVGEPSGSDIEELESLNLLQGKLCLSGLNNVTDPTHALKSRLQDKKYLEEIHMIFDGSVVESNVSVLDALQPNNNLKRLTIENYNGNMFPNWLSGFGLPNLISLKLHNCNGIKIFGNDSTNVPFKFLEVLEFDCMSEWEEWLCIEGFPLLKELYIRDCPKLKKALPPHLPSLHRLVISGCKMLDVSILNFDEIRVLDLRNCKRILINELSSSLKRFVLRENQYVEFSMDHLINNPFLEVLSLDFKGFVECPSLDLCCYNSLGRLTIRGWQSSSSPFCLPLFTNLCILKLFDCPRLESFLIGGLPSKLWSLLIHNCPKLIASREEWGLFQLNSLTHFMVSDDFENLELFPEQNLLPPTLTNLHLGKCSKLRILNYKGFLHLKSLSSIWIDNCPSLESLPEEGLPNSLYNLYIEDCPLVKEKYKKEGGERWHTISHIPRVFIDYIRQE
ncbi:putative disease resistance RPP13-like protein 1 [Vicia villosa]|uniref:putative disease resistance RPP13-like protein 1 n=1 Tax=Vicia villosa TaxID=3911 RepID=UPI00273CCCDE|nr:putative disease resistance RPP13-like protein 1 [Vicia villosa]XP_058721435.1 putative disease resistance RPP13-like protein 1 [Vicia villosa]XP_058721436.1 putative disease resistance RPP13-like protein 1 [Vicia villosa]XP_058721437.1 putative disease resistance RPP13-like protein 1 [Vicia villosa]